MNPDSLFYSNSGRFAFALSKDGKLADLMRLPAAPGIEGPKLILLSIDDLWDLRLAIEEVVKEMSSRQLR